MDRRERLDDEEEKLRMYSESALSNVWTAVPVYVVNYYPATQTCDLQPTIMSRIIAPNGKLSFAQLPVLLDCPVAFPTGGGFTLTFPIAAGDEGLAVFSSRCIDGWWQNGGVQIPPEIRLHDLSDGFYIPGTRSKPNAIGSISTSTVQLRNSSGDTYVEIASGGVVNVAAPTQINLNSPVVTVAGIINVQNENSVANPCTIAGKITATGDVIANSGGTAISLVSHVHSGVTTGGGNTGPAH